MADRVSMKVRGLDRSLARLRRIVPTLDAEMDKAFSKSAAEVAELSASLAPRDSGEYAASITSRRIDGVATFQNRKNVQTRRGTKLSVSTRRVSATMSYGVFADWIWQFLEFGTVKSAAQPHLFPAYRLLKKRITGRGRRAMNKAIRSTMR